MTNYHKTYTTRGEIITHTSRRRGDGAQTLLESLEDNPLIARVTDDAGLRSVLASDCRVVFLLYGSVLDVAATVRRLKDAGKTVCVGVDLLDGLSNRTVVVQFVKEHTTADGILSTRAPLVKEARRLGLVAVHRFFLVDSMSFRHLAPQVALSDADFVEMLPGCMPRVIGWVRDATPVPVIAGGLVCDRDDVVAALGAGATAVASSNVDVWSM